uniref:Uncharacterized protein n=1 Tax=Siphoviridae sp. cthSp75 TaxID=2826424 RepID=A0A8S5NDF7_9CAUD|nr:MAG TPA: hypothetical protein [Siphoviridae sp. cthSp75]
MRVIWKQIFITTTAAVLILVPPINDGLTKKLLNANRRLLADKAKITCIVRRVQPCLRLCLLSILLLDVNTLLPERRNRLTAVMAPVTLNRQWIIRKLRKAAISLNKAAIPALLSSSMTALM